MLELALLGVQPDGQTLTLNDDEGNRYTLPITDELRAALRRDRATSQEDAAPKPTSPKEIQAHFRAGLSLEEVSDLTNMPVSSLAPFEFPIRAEREYTAQRARSFRIGHEIGGLTVEELVASRLRSRDVSPSAITWDSYKEQGGVWKLRATYPAGGRTTTAIWDIDADSSSLHACNDEATWLSETEIPAKDAPWRPLSKRSSVVSTPPAEDSPESPDSSESASSADSPDEAPQQANAELVSMLDGLNSRRGKPRPAPTFDEEEDLPPAAHPPHSQPEEATDATVLSLPKRVQPTDESDESAPSPVSPADIESADSAKTAEGVVPSASTPIAPEDDGLFAEPEPEVKPKAKPKKRSGNRPTMPSWDEIVFGHPKKD